MLNRASPPRCLWLERTGQAWARTCVRMCAHMCPSMSPLICPASPICPTCASHMPHMSHIASPHVPYVHSYVRSTCVLTYRSSYVAYRSLGRTGQGTGGDIQEQEPNPPGPLSVRDVPWLSLEVGTAYPTACPTACPTAYPTACPTAYPTVISAPFWPSAPRCICSCAHRVLICPTGH